MSGPRLLDLYCGDGGVATGYHRAGFEVVGVDIEDHSPRYPFEFHQGDAFEYLAAHWQEFDVLHGSPVCKIYSVMNNLPWLRGKEYPAHILPLREAFEAIGKPYIIENVMGARYGAKGLAKRGLAAHGMQAGWLCGTMFGLPLYRHRLFETNWPWLAPGHPAHIIRIQAGRDLKDRGHSLTFDGWRLGDPPLDSNAPRSQGYWEAGYEAKKPGASKQASLAAWQQGNGAQKAGVGVGHAKGWRLAAAAMGVEWMDRDGTSQAIPPAFTEWLGGRLMEHLMAQARA